MWIMTVTILAKDGDLQNDLEAKIMCVFFSINRLQWTLKSSKALLLDILSSNILNCNYIEINTKTSENDCL